MKEFLESRYPELQGKIQGANYPAHPGLQLLATVAGFMQTFGMIFVFFGDKLFGMMGLPEPPWFLTLKDNKMMAFGAFFMFNTVAQNLVSTGAFEVHHNGQRIYSKLELGRMPDANMIAGLLKKRGLFAQ